MSKKKKDHGGDETSEATTKLSRLLETEVELEAMLKHTRREAKRLVEAARATALDRAKQFESQLQGEDAALRDRIARERDQAIDSIQEEARDETTRLDELDDAKITGLARYVVDLLVGRPDSGGPH